MLLDDDVSRSGQLPSRWLGVGVTHRRGERTIQAAMSLQLMMETLESVVRGTSPLDRRCHHIVAEGIRELVRRHVRSGRLVYSE